MFISTKQRYFIKFFLKVAMWLGLFFFAAYCSACIFLFFYQPRLIFFPSPNLEKTPAHLNIPYQEVWLPVEVTATESQLIHGWWMRANKPSDRVLLYLHGNSQNISANLNRANWFRELGFSVLLIDYRGYGRSQGNFPNELQVYQDAAVAWNYLHEKQKIPSGQIFIYGHSLGGAIAIDLAVKQPYAGGLIIESSFTSIREMVDYQSIFSIFPVDLILTQRFESIKKLPNLKMPVLFIHGSNDSTVPAFMSESLYAVAPEPKKIITIPNAGHNNLVKVASYEYKKAVRSLIKMSEFAFN